MPPKNGSMPLFGYIIGASRHGQESLTGGRHFLDVSIMIALDSWPPHLGSPPPRRHSSIDDQKSFRSLPSRSAPGERLEIKRSSQARQELVRHPRCQILLNGLTVSVCRRLPDLLPEAQHAFVSCRRSRTPPMPFARPLGSRR